MGQPLDQTAQEQAKRPVLTEHFVQCGTRRVQGAEISVCARPGRC
ncbi:hypothetical protein QF037_002099 [Streptomyces canus]|nr:hypothetical protein [Streptomyces canus]MDQ0597754.1 hypothetical protein [Streptomyces canus]